ncbi:MAG TPA: oligopeptide:H+ symporter, partial [Vicinamibacterales bacterium]|nr:oligopeptide:H+ symporter [Vicinamibacterales bacterium]
MSTTAATTPADSGIPEFKQVMGHPGPLWMLFMSEFWERFAFYGIRWALVLYIVAQFHDGSATGQAEANLTYGAYLALVYAGAIFGGYVADKVLGYQRSILLGAVFMSAGLFMVAWPDPIVFELGLATIVVGNGLFKPIISTIVGKLYATGDERRDSGFTIFYMGINAGAFIAPIITGYLAEHVFGTEAAPAYKYVFIASAIGMLVSMVWFWIGRAQLKGIGAPTPEMAGLMRVVAVAIGGILAIPVVYFLLAVGGTNLQYVLTVMFIGLSVTLIAEGIREGAVARDRAIAMLLIFAFNI